MRFGRANAQVSRTRFSRLAPKAPCWILQHAPLPQAQKPPQTCNKSFPGARHLIGARMCRTVALFSVLFFFFAIVVVDVPGLLGYVSLLDALDLTLTH